MSRPIKVRAWDKVDGRMIVDEQDFIPLMITNKGVFRLSPHHSENLWEMMDAERFEFMQYTGLTDRNGKEIYESDIVSVWNMLRENIEPYTAVVEWDKYRFALKTIGKSDFRAGIPPMMDLDPFGLNLTVIGSVYTHPHLMEVQA